MLLRSLSIGLVALASSFSVTAQSNCSSLLDHDQDGVIGVPDLMNLLSFFGGPADDSPCVEGPPECGGATTVTFDGYTYDLVAIGSQCWFAENLRTTHFANGDSIPGNLTDSEWTSTSSGATTVYGEGTTPVWAGSDDELANLENYGRLYNWYAVDDSRGLCPSGWHVSTNDEWITLEMELGMTSSEANSTGWRGTDQGALLKSSFADTPSWNGTNTFGFSALPGGIRSMSNGGFNLQGVYGYWWVVDGTMSRGCRIFYSGSSTVGRCGSPSPPRNGFSVRCVRDE